MSPATETVFRVVRQLGLPVTRTWLALIAVDPDSEEFLDDLESEISAQMDLPLRIVPAGALSIPELARQLAQNDSDCVALIGLENWGPATRPAVQSPERWRSAG